MEKLTLPCYFELNLFHSLICFICGRFRDADPICFIGIILNPDLHRGCRSWSRRQNYAQINIY